MSDNEIINIVKKIANNMCDIEFIDNLLVKESNSNLSYINNYEYFGICFLLSELERQFPKEGKWGVYAHKYLEKIINNIKEHGIVSSSLFLGASSLGLLLYNLSYQPNNYKNILNSVNNYILKDVNDKLNRIDINNVKPQDYDLIQGISGILVYLILFKEDEEINKLINRIIKKLILFSESHTYNDYFIPNFFVKSYNHMTEIEANLFPNGSFNTSLSHGISGIIASLSIAIMNGIKIDMQENAIVKLITFLEKYKMYINDKVFWKGAISLEEFYENKSNKDNGLLSIK